MTRKVPIRWKLTVWYAAFLGLVLLVLGSGLYLALRDRLYESLDEQIGVQRRLVESQLRVVDGDPVLDGSLTLLDDNAIVRLLSSEGTIVAERGEVIDNAASVSSAVGEARQGRTVISNMRAEEGSLRVLTAPVLEGGEIAGVLQVGLPADEVDGALGEVLSLLMLSTPLVLLSAVGGGYLLAGRALRPVATITTLAGRIGERDLSSRLDLALPDDELGRLAHTFDDMLERIEEAFERQRRFTGDVAHELRTPLGLLRSQVDVALARPRSMEEYREALQGVDIDLGRLVRLVNTLLTLARAEAGQLRLELAPCELSDTIELVLEQYAAVADEEGLTLVNESSPTPLVADEGLLIQVLVNLLDNAIAHTPSGGRIAAGCRAEGTSAHLWVADTGSGIPTELRFRVFDRFYRVDAGRSRKQGGSGLGLAIAKAIVDAHGGDISIASQRGPGTRVDVVLPSAQRSTVAARDT